MAPYANQANVKLRWRLGSDNSVSATGWNVDDIELQTVATVNMRTSLFNAVDTRVDIKDTVTMILPLANPNVTINQAVGQADPTITSPINFTAVFDQPVIGFTDTDVTLSGTAGATTATVTGGPTTFNIAVSGMTATGTVIADIAAGVCTNAALDPNSASTSTDNVVNFSLQPLNDDCANAALITCGQTISGSTLLATIETPVNPFCGTSVTAPGVWYRFIGNGGNTTVSTCSFADYDTKISVYSGTCAALICEGGNDDFCGLQSSVTIATTPGATYYVLVHGFGAGVGTFDLTLTCTCPTLSVDPVPNQTVCNGLPTTAINFTGLEPGTVYTWVNNTPSIGLAASGTGNIASFTATNTGTTAVTATITVTPTYPGCPDGPSEMFTITVNPSPNAVATPSSQTICSGSAITTIVLTGSVTGTTYGWTRNNTGSVTGIAASGSGDISGSLTNTTSAPVTVTFTITPMANGCTGPTTTATVLVNPTPNAVATPSSQNACSGSAITPIVLTSSVAGATFTWTRDNTATVTGIAASGSGNITGVLNNTTGAAVTVTFTITPTANGCTGPTTTATVIVNPVPSVDNIPNQTVCNGTMTAPVNFTGPIAGTIFTWSNNTPSIGLAASGVGNIPAFTATNATTNPVTATVTVTPQIAQPGPVVFTGSLDVGDPTLTAGRINRNAVASSCAVPKTFPGIFGTGPYFYDLYTLINTTGAAQCVTVSYSSTTANQVHVTAYNGSFNPANIAHQLYSRWRQQFNRCTGELYLYSTSRSNDSLPCVRTTAKSGMSWL